MKTQHFKKPITAVTASLVLAMGSMATMALAAEPMWASKAQMEVESATQFAEMKASMPLITDRETIDYIACVANAIVNILEPPFSNQGGRVTNLYWRQELAGGRAVLMAGFLDATGVPRCDLL